MRKVTTVAEYSEASKRFDAIVSSRHKRAFAVIRAAGLEHAGLLHNALVGLHYGKPWAEVDYKLARKAKWMLSHVYDGREILDRMWTRVCREQYGYQGD